MEDESPGASTNPAHMNVYKPTFIINNSFQSDLDKANEKKFLRQQNAASLNTKSGHTGSKQQIIKASQSQ